jgi:hypothetical protein
MRVKELMELLSQFPPDMYVIRDDFYDYEDVSTAEIIVPWTASEEHVVIR